MWRRDGKADQVWGNLGASWGTGYIGAQVGQAGSWVVTAMVGDDDSGWRRYYELSRTTNKFAGKIGTAVPKQACSGRADG